MREKQFRFFETIKALAAIIVILLPIYAGIWLSAFLELSHITVSGDIKIIGGWPQPIGLAASLILLFIHAKKQRMSWADFGIRKQKNWIATLIKGAVISGIIFVAVGLIINPAIRNLLPDSTRNMSRFDFLYQNEINLAIQLVLIWITAAFLEELLWRGFIIEKLLALTDEHGFLKTASVLLASSIIFGFAHVYQGPVGMMKTGAIGLVFGCCYFLFKRDLVPLIIAHGFIDTFDMISHYLGG